MRENEKLRARLTDLQTGGSNVAQDPWKLRERFNTLSGGHSIASEGEYNGRLAALLSEREVAPSVDDLAARLESLRGVSTRTSQSPTYDVPLVTSNAHTL